MTNHPFKITVGTTDAWVLQDASIRAPLNEFLKGSSDTTEVELSINPLLLKLGPYWVLFDTGDGAGVRAQMAALGVRPEQVDWVVLTHAHGDHICGLTLPDGDAAFTNARILITRAEWEWATAPARLAGLDAGRRAVIQANMLVLRDRYQLLDGSDTPLPGISLIPSPGHTPGHAAIVLESRGETLVFAGDTLHVPQHLAHPEVCTTFDVQPELTEASRRKVLDYAVAHKAVLSVYHFPFPGIGRVQRAGHGYKQMPL